MVVVTSGAQILLSMTCLHLEKMHTSIHVGRRVLSEQTLPLQIIVRLLVVHITIRILELLRLLHRAQFLSSLVLELFRHYESETSIIATSDAWFEAKAITHGRGHPRSS